MNKTISSVAVLLLVGLFGYFGLMILDKPANKVLGNGINTPPVSNYATSTVYTITNSDTYVEATTSRTYYSFTNASAIGIWLECVNGRAAAVNRGVLITASTTYEMSVSKGNSCYGPIHAISAGAGSILVVTGF